MSMHLFAFFIAIFLPCASFASQSTMASDLERRLSALRTTSGMSAKFEKSVYQALQQQTDKSSGSFSVRKGAFRVQQDPPNETLLVVNSQAVWLETPMGDDFPVSVQKLSRSKLKGSSGIWNVVASGSKLTTMFKISQTTKSGQSEFVLESKKKDSIDLKSIRLVYKGLDLKSLEYTDDIDNVVTYKFESWKTSSIAKSKFDYKPPKNAEVTEL